MKSRRIAGGLVMSAALGLAFALVGVAPANAASCWGAGSDGTVASASCSGVGNVRVNVRCNAIWPFTPWTDYGPWFYINGGGNPANLHASCGASLTVWAEY